MDKVKSPGNYIIRKMKREDLDLAIEWAAAEGWNPGQHDADIFYSVDPGGFFIGELDGEPVSCISVVKYDDNFCFLGFYIVKPEFRGKGYGLKIWNEALKYSGNINIGLDGVVAQQDNYMKSGFKPAYRNIRYEGIANGVMPEGIIDAMGVRFEEVLEYDTKLFPASRAGFLWRWISQDDSFAMAIPDKDQIRGYGVIRKCRTGFKIGPLFADEPDIAGKLFNALTSTVKGEKIYFDVPEVNKSAIEIAEKANMHVVFETARMYTGKSPSIDMNKIYGVTTFELG